MISRLGYKQVLRRDSNAANTFIRVDRARSSQLCPLVRYLKIKRGHELRKGIWGKYLKLLSNDLKYS